MVIASFVLLYLYAGLTVVGLVKAILRHKKKMGDRPTSASVGVWIIVLIFWPIIPFVWFLED